MPNASPDGIVPTRKQAAAALGITPRQLGDWTSEPWFPPVAVETDSRGTRTNWNVPLIRSARDAAGRKGSELSDQAKKLKLSTDLEKFRQSQLETEKRRLSLETQKGALIPRDALELFASTLLTSLGDWCDTLGDLIAADVPKKYRRAVRDRVKTELDSRREQTAAELAAAARDFDTHSVEVDQQKS